MPDYKLQKNAPHKTPTLKMDNFHIFTVPTNLFVSKFEFFSKGLSELTLIKMQV